MSRRSFANILAQSKIALALVVLVTVSLLSACAAARDLASTVDNEGGRPGVSSAQGGAGAAAPPSASRASAPAPAARPAEAERPSADSSLAASADQAAVPWDRRIIRNVSLQLVAEDVEQAVAQARGIVTSVDGFVAQSQTRYDGDRLFATLTFQVPAGSFDSVVNQLRALATRVESENGSSQDVTEEYVDLEAQIRNLQATEASLQRLLDQATRIEDILVINRELSQVRAQIERFQGRLNFLNRRTEFGTISVQFTPVGVAQPPQVTGWQPVETARRAFEASLRVVQGVVDAVITIVVFFWWLVPIMIVLIPIARALATRRRTASPPTPPAPTA